MGVKLQDLVRRQKIDISDLSGKIITVDAPNIIMGLLNFSLKNPTSENANLILDKTQRPISHLYGILYRVKFYYTKKILPIFCFDGRDSNLKRIITKDRLNDFRYTQFRYTRAIESKDMNLARQISLSREYMWPNILEESRSLLGALGVPYIDSPASAESQCAELVKQNIADYSNSQDYDSLLFGCPHIIQNLSKSQSRKQQNRWVYNKVEPMRISLKETLTSLNINQFQLVDISFMLGTDYFSGIQGIGHKKALEFIKRYKSIEGVISSQRNYYDFSKLTPGIIQQIRKIFLFPEVLSSFEPFHWSTPNTSKVMELLCTDHNLNKERVEKNVGLLSKHHKWCRTYFSKPQTKQKTLKLYF